MKLAVVLEYDGTNYCGFQYQKDVPTIQEELEKSIKALTGERVRVKAAGRTDARVHALGQVVCFELVSGLTCIDVRRGLNHFLPSDIAVKDAHVVSQTFDPRREALSRTYVYSFFRSRTRSPIRRTTSHRIPVDIDIEKMRTTALSFKGCHDFKRFAGPLESKDASTVRRIYKIEMKDYGDILELEMQGNAFLPHQVRRMAGAILDVGRGKLEPSVVRGMIEGNGVEGIAHSLPPQGLKLVSVEYKDFPPRVGE